MGAELPVSRIWHAHPCLYTNTEIGVLCTNTCLAAKYALLGVQAPYFGCNRTVGPIYIERIGQGSEIDRKRNFEILVHLVHYE